MITKQDLKVGTKGEWLVNGKWIEFLIRPNTDLDFLLKHKIKILSVIG